MKRLLIVDDFLPGAQAAADAIEKLAPGEFIVEKLTDGYACLQRLTQPPPVDVVLLDIDLPGLSGAEVIRTVVGWRPVPALRFVPQTAWGLEWMRIFGVEALREDDVFKALVARTYDKANGPLELIEALREAAGPPVNF